MKVLIFHGYLLRGTGSNVYNASLATALARLGHEVHLLCQDRHAGELSWVDRVGGWDSGVLRIERARRASGARDQDRPGQGRLGHPGLEPAGGGSGPGTVTAYRPDIGDLLPVYVADEYEGFSVKTFSDLSDAELDRYLDSNVAAVRDVVEGVDGVDAALANHLIMGPAILARAGLRFALKIHGSALEYTVKPHPERFLPYAREGVDACAGILVGSGHTARSLWRALDDPKLPAKTRLGPPGVDTELFAPIPRSESATRLREFADALEAEAPGPPGEPAATDFGPPGGAWDRNPNRAAAVLRLWADASGPRVVFVGKLIVSKGIDLLLAAWPLVHAAHPGARLLVVGFGEYERTAMRLWTALQAGEWGAVRQIAVRGWGLEGGEEAPLKMLSAFLDHPPAGYWEAAAEAAGAVMFAGRLEHEEVGRLLPAADALVMPSTFPESFGMVAAEAAAAGVPPVSAAHSGMAEVSQALADGLPHEAAGLVSFELDEQAVESLAARINGWLGLDPEVREPALNALHGVAARRWSWEGVARGVLAASAGRLDALSAPHPR